MKLQLKWGLIHNKSLGDYLTSNAAELRNSCQRLLTGNSNYGNYLCRAVLQPNIESPELQQEHHALWTVLKTFQNINDEYYFHNFELHLKDNSTAPTPRHSDLFTWMYSDDKLVNQIWVLLYNDFPNNEGNLDLYDNAIENGETGGLFSKRCKTCVATVDGYKDFQPREVFNGSIINLGDILIFQNGVVHASKRPSTLLRTGSYRLALAMSFYKKEWNLTTNLVSYMHNFWATDQQKPRLSQLLLRDLQTRPYAIKVIGTADSRPPLMEAPQRRDKEQDEEWFEKIKLEILNLQLT